MNVHDSHKDSHDTTELAEALKKIAPEFNEKTLDIQDIAKYSNDPLFISMLLFKLIKEREETNKIMQRIEDKYDKVMFRIKVPQPPKIPPEAEAKKEFDILPEQDQVILDYVDKKGKCTATEIMHVIGYKKQNAASQRLNKLYREGHLRKIRAGKKVVYILGSAQNIPNLPHT